MPGKICFRGDTRSPNAPDDIFTRGFTRRDPGGAIVYRQNAPNAGDIAPRTAVCVSARISAATLFPLRFDANDPAVSDIFLYVLNIDTADLFNTHERQVTDSFHGLAVHHDPAQAMWPLFAHELCTEQVAAGDVIAAVRCTRTWNGNDWTAGANYLLQGPVLLNPNCTVAAELRMPATTFINDELANHANGTTPRPDSGYHPSTPRAV